MFPVETVLHDVAPVRIRPVSKLSDRYCHVIELWSPNFGDNFISSRNCRGLPYIHGLVAKLAQCLSGNQMALEVESVLDGGVGG